MSQLKAKTSNSATRRFSLVLAAVVLVLAITAQAAAPGITGPLTSKTPVFNLDAQPAYLTQPDGAMIYSWGYGCSVPPSGFAPAAITTGTCPTMQVPGPTLIVHEGDQVTVNLTNNLPTGAGNTSIIFTGFQVTPSGGVNGLLTMEAVPAGTGSNPAPNSTMTYKFTAFNPGTYAYYSGTQPDLQIEMGLYGAVIVLPTAVPAGCTAPAAGSFKLAASAYDHAATCYDREYLFQFAEIDPRIHRQAEVQLQAIAACTAPTTADPCPTLSVATEPYRPAYFVINGRSMPDDMDGNYVDNYPHQPYNGNPHMHPGDQTLIRVIGVGHLQHPFHEHGNHVRILARDGNLILSQTDPSKLAGRLEFTTDTTPGQAFDGIFYWSGRGLNWDIYNHQPGDGTVCTPDANGYYTTASGAPTTAPNYYEWCADHLKQLDTANGGPATPPDPNIVTNGLWYGGSPYLGIDARTSGNRQVGPTPLPPSTSVQNPEAGIAFMWHSHNEREITTNDVFPGGMLMMMLVDPPSFFIDEAL
jgi:FtsP/CotA-like multicopper oxidase with cupredoxin domain